MKPGKRYSVATFFLLAYLITWGIQVPMAVLHIDIGSPLGRALNVLAIFGPALAAILLALMRGGFKGFVALLSAFGRWRAHWGWYAIALLSPYGLVALAMAVNIALGGSAPVLANSGALLLGFALEWVRILVFGGPLGEELGWRGYALPRLQETRTAIKASLILGLVWGLWHLPSYFISGTGQYEAAQSGQFWFTFPGFLAWTIALSILLAWLYNNTGGSLLVVMLFHTAVNSAVNLPFLLQVSDFTVPLLNVLLTWVLAVLVLNLSGSAKLQRLPVGEPTA